MAPLTGALRTLELDHATGLPASFSRSRQAEEGRWRELHGALHHSLVEWLERAEPSASVDIVITPKVPTPFQRQEVGGSSKRAEAVAAAVREAGASITGRSGGPAILARTSRETLQDVIAYLPGIEAIHPDLETEVQSLKAARDLVEGPLLLAHSLGVGGDLSIAVYEPDACIRREHSDFQLVTFETRIGLGQSCDPRSAQAGTGRARRRHVPVPR
ncbi:MAG: hypothetical protein LJE91_08030 [Gammaproteobacteria bacterium]|jgi:hypothetical protein|nr:hypothetical protein [Gammaproteobacteria bacterium]